MMNQKKVVKHLIKFFKNQSSLCMTKLNKRTKKQTMPSNREKIIEIIGDGQEVIFYDGFDEAIVGTSERDSSGPTVVVYDIGKCLEILMKDMVVKESELEDGETIESKKFEMAQEHFEYNVIGGWIGDTTPVFINTINK